MGRILDLARWAPSGDNSQPWRVRIDGSISGELVRFTVTVEEQVGNLFLPLKYTFTGRIKGAEIELTREREANPNMGYGGGNRGNQKPTFTLKRLL